MVRYILKFIISFEQYVCNCIKSCTQISESRLTRVVKRFVNIEQDKVNILQYWHFIILE